MIYKLVVALFLGCGYLFTVAAEKVNLEVFASNLDSISVAIVPFVEQTSTVIREDEPWKVIANDLDFSGKFSVKRALKIDTLDFLHKNIPLYISGSYAVTGTTIDFECQLRDSKSSELIFGNKYSGSLKNMRTLAHTFSNQLYETIFQGKPIFTSKIIFVKDDAPVKNIALMDWDGGNQTLLTKEKTINIFPSFIDSNSFLYTSYLRGHPNIYEGQIHSNKSTYLVPSRYVDTSPAYSPITGKIVFASSRDGNMEIYTSNSDGSDIKRCTFSKSIETAPCWSPNGFQIAFTSDRAGNPQIYIMDADGSNVHRLSYEGGYQDSPAWSPKGDKIAFHSNTTGKFEIWINSVEGTAPFQVTNVQGSNEYPSWSPDGEHIVFCSARGAKNDLFAIKTDGTHCVRLTNTGNAKMPDWSNF